LNEEYKKEYKMRVDFEEKFSLQLKTLSSNTDNIKNLTLLNEELNKNNNELEHQVTDIKELVKDLENCSKSALVEANRLKDELASSKNNLNYIKEK